MKVSHVQDRTFTVYIGRPTIFGNPYIIGRDGNRTQCIRKFEKRAWKDHRLLAAIAALKPNAILGCHCHPKPCHGTIIIAIYRSLRKQAKSNAAIVEAANVSRLSHQSAARYRVRRLQRKS